MSVPTNNPERMNETDSNHDEVTEARKWNISTAIKDLLEFQKIAIERNDEELLQRIPEKIELIAETYSKFR